MEVISLAVGLLPVVNQLYDYLKQVKDAPETCRALNSELESYINYTHQVEKLKQTDASPSVGVEAEDLQHHKAALEKLQQILKNLQVVELIKNVQSNPETPADDALGTGAQQLNSDLDSDSDFDEYVLLDDAKPKKLQQSSGSQPSSSNIPPVPASERRIMIQQFKWPFEKNEATELLQALKESSEVLAQGLLVDYSGTSTESNSGIKELRDNIQIVKPIADSNDSSRIKMLDWLSPLTFRQKHEEIISQHYKGTGEWFLNNEIFREWLDGSRGALLCHGMPGAGKTTLASLVVNECLIKCNDSSAIGVICIYFDYKNEQNQTITNIIGGILRQLEALVTIEPALSNVYSQHHNTEGVRPLSLSTMIERIKLCLAKFATVYLILDALDECSVRDELLHEHIAELLSSDSQTALKLFGTSRVIPELESFFANYSYPQLSISASDEDIRCYLEARLEHYKPLQKPLYQVVEQSVETRKLLVERICQQASGIFLAARLQIEYLAYIPNENALRACLQELPKGLDATYEMYINRLKRQSEDSWFIARTAFMWVTYAARPLTLQQLLEAIAAESSSSPRLTDKEALLLASGGLLQVAEEPSSPVEFIHFSTKEYFMRNPHIFLLETPSHDQIEALEKEIQGHIALMCLNQMINVPKQFRDSETWQEGLYAFGFLQYAIGYWGLHAKQANQEHITPVLHSLFDEYLEPEKRGERVVFVLQPDVIYSSQDSASDPVTFELLLSCYREGFAIGSAAIFGLQSLVWEYLEARPDIDGILSNIPHFGLLLMHGIATGEETVLERFIQSGFDLNQPLPVKEFPALHLAVRYDRPAVVERLLGLKQVDPNQTDQNGCTALLHLCQLPTGSVSKGQDLDMLRLLLTRDDLDINKPNAHGTTPLHAAVSVGNSGLVQSLLASRKINPNQITHSGENALRIAVNSYVDACYRHGESQDQSTAAARYNILVHLLAREDLNPNLTTFEDGVPPLHCLLSSPPNGTAVVPTYLQDILPLFLARTDLDVNKTDRKGQTALMLALSLDVGHDEIIKLILARPDIDVNVADGEGRTALLRASRSPELVEIVQLLLAREDIDINRSDNTGTTALMNAASSSAETVKLLLSRPNIDDINKSNNTGTTALIIAASNPVSESLNLLLTRPEIDINKPDSAGQTALMIAVSAKVPENVQLLLTRPDIDFNKKDNTGKTALMIAVLGSSHTITGYLLAKPGIDINQTDNEGKTAVDYAEEKEDEVIITLLKRGGE